MMKSWFSDSSYNSNDDGVVGGRGQGRLGTRRKKSLRVRRPNRRTIVGESDSEDLTPGGSLGAAGAGIGNGGARSVKTRRKRRAPSQGALATGGILDRKKRAAQKKRTTETVTTTPLAAEPYDPTRLQAMGWSIQRTGRTGKCVRGTTIPGDNFKLVRDVRSLEALMLDLGITSTQYHWRPMHLDKNCTYKCMQENNVFPRNILPTASELEEKLIKPLPAWAGETLRMGKLAISQANAAAVTELAKVRAMMKKDEERKMQSIPISKLAKVTGKE